MRPYLLKGHELYMDNYYNSVPLSEKLLDLKTHTCGTLRSNRKGNPTSLVKKKLKKDEYIWLRKGKFYVSNWRDKRQVLMLTTLDQPEMIKVTNKRGQEVKRPKEIAQYNRFMSGIDCADQMISYYSCPRKTIRWYKKIIFHMLDVATWNAFFLFKRYVIKNNVKKYGYVEYRDKLIKCLTKIGDDVVGKDLVSVDAWKRYPPKAPEPSISVPQMPRKGTRTTTKASWTVESLENAVSVLKRGGISVYKVSQQTGIPYSTVKKRYNLAKADDRSYKNSPKLGRRTVFNVAQEEILANHLRTMSSKFYGLTREQFRKATSPADMHTFESLMEWEANDPGDNIILSRIKILRD
ncbi:hypothetical protein HF086_012315 [Spodoptera exigua]|uniref:PiggyBac transposable element-derived protein domain-containing protein n=1 Tax=Spodoptera exigua TaxID=7107 RepID=A0A922MTF2_SPOEX|nr:hypothetical protein HF086_012315 [Spodoptera exigua]